MFFRKRSKRLLVYCDGAIGDGSQGSGLGVVIRDAQGEIIGLLKRGMPPMTNNEAEYAALVLALKSARRFRPHALVVYMDSEVVVGQMQGRFAVRSLALRRWHSEACRLARCFQQLDYVHVPREINRLADALAAEALMERSNVRARQL